VKNKPRCLRGEVDCPDNVLDEGDQAHKRGQKPWGVSENELGGQEHSDVSDYFADT
jgi:hypothetical protein